MAEDSIEGLPRTRKEALAIGVKHYFTGEPCKKGHIAVRRTKGDCLSCQREREKARYLTERDKKREMDRVRHAANRENGQARCRAWYAANRDKSLARNRAWRSANADKLRVYNHARNAMKRNAEGKHTASDIDLIRRAQKDRCGYCKENLRGGGQVDHIIALSKGGSDWPRNLQILCAPCNQSKNARDPITFAHDLGLLC